MRLTIPAVLLAAGLAGCGIPMHQQLSDGTHEVIYHFDPSIDDGQAGARKHLPALAGMECPGGWRKLSEREVDMPQGAKRIIWHIDCL